MFIFQWDSFDLMEKLLWKVLEFHFDPSTWRAIGMALPCLRDYCRNEVISLKLSKGHNLLL